MDNPISQFPTRGITRLWKSCLYPPANSLPTKFSTSPAGGADGVGNGIFCIIPGNGADVRHSGKSGCGNPGQSGRFGRRYPSRHGETGPPVSWIRTAGFGRYVHPDESNIGELWQTAQQNPLIHNFALTTAATTTAFFKLYYIYLIISISLNGRRRSGWNPGRPGVSDAGCAAISSGRNCPEKPDMGGGKNAGRDGNPAFRKQNDESCSQSVRKQRITGLVDTGALVAEKASCKP